MDKEPDILDIIQYGLNRKSLQENNPEKFLELEKYFQNEDNKKKFFETDLEMDWDDELSKSSQYPKPEKLNLKKNKSKKKEKRIRVFKEDLSSVPSG